MDYFIGALKKYADFTGRARRKEYWMFLLFYFLFLIGFAVIDFVLSTEIFLSLFTFALFIPMISVTTRRLHDTGRSGWWQLISFLVIFFLVQESHGTNDYGVNPKSD